MDISFLWGYVPNIIRLAEESLEVAFIVCNDDFREFGWLEVLDAFDQTFTSAYVLGTGFWPFYQSTNGFCLCVCGRFGLFCKHTRNSTHWLSRKFNKERIFSSKYFPVIPCDYIVKVTPAFDLRPGYTIMISICIQEANDMKTFSFWSRYEYITQLYQCYSSIIFNPHPKRLNTYGSFLKKLQSEHEKKAAPLIYNLDRKFMPEHTLILKYSSLPLCSFAESDITANLFKQTNYKTQSTQTYWEDIKYNIPEELFIKPPIYQVLPLLNNPWKVNGTDLMLPAFSSARSQSVASSTLQLVENENRPPPSYEEFEESKRKSEAAPQEPENFEDCFSDIQDSPDCLQSDPLELPLSISTIEDEQNSYQYFNRNIKVEEHQPTIKSEYPIEIARGGFQQQIKTEMLPYNLVKVEREEGHPLQFPPFEPQPLPLGNNFIRDDYYLDNSNHQVLYLPNRAPIPPANQSFYLRNKNYPYYPYCGFNNIEPTTSGCVDNSGYLVHHNQLFNDYPPVMNQPINSSQKSRGRGRKARNPHRIDVSPYRPNINDEKKNLTEPMKPQKSARKAPRASYSQIVKSDQIVIDLTNNEAANKRSYASVLRNNNSNSEIKSLLSQPQNLKASHKTTDEIIQQLIKLEDNNSSSTRQNTREVEEKNAILQELMAFRNEDAAEKQRQINEQFEIAEEFIREEMEREAKARNSNCCK